MEDPEQIWPPRPETRITSAGYIATWPSGMPTFTWEQAARVLRKNGRFAVWVAAGLTLAVVAGALSLRDVYKPVARLEIDPLSGGIKTLHEIDDSAPIDNQDYLETQVQVLQSDALGMSVIRSLHLDRNPEFVSSSQRPPLASARERATNPSAEPGLSYLSEQFALADRTPLESIALSSFQRRLSISPVRNSRLIEVSFASHDPQLAQTITNDLVTQFMNQNYKNRYTSTMAASEWLSAQLSDLHGKVDEANQAVSDFQKKYGFVDADDPDVPLTQLMGEVNHQLADAQASRIETEAFVHMVDLGQSDSVPALRDDQLYQNLTAQHAALLGQLAQARTVYGDENSNVKKLESASTELANQLADERTRVIDRLRVSLTALRARENMTRTERENVRRQMGEASSHSVEYRVLKNEAAASADLYNTLQARLREAGIYAGLGSSNIHVIDLAPKLRNASEPHRALIIGFGGVVSCFLALALAFVKESFDNTVRTPEDVRTLIGVPSLAMIPPIGGRSVRRTQSLLSKVGLTNGSQRLSSLATPVLMKPRTEESEAIRELRAALSYSRSGTAVRVVLVTSPSDGEGKTTVAANLAVAFSRWGKTCLVDGDLRRSSAAEVFGIVARDGLGQCLAGSASVPEILVPAPSIKNLTILPAGSSLADPGDLIASEKMRTTLTELRNEFDHVVIDSPPVIPFADPRILSLLSDAVVLVGRYGVTTRRAMSRGRELLDEIRAPFVGVVVNDIQTDSADYRYYNYGFSRRTNGYRDYYAQQGLPDSVPSSQSEPPKSKGAHA